MTRTSELIDEDLDRMVRKIVNNDDALRSALGIFVADSRFHPSTNWAQGGPIIERGLIETRHDGRQSWCAWHKDRGAVHGPTPLIAAMRCYVASKLGDEVDVPKEFV